MAYLIGSSSISAYTTNTAITNNSNYANYCGTAALSVTPNASGTATKLNLYIASYTTIANIKVVLYENGTLLSQATYNLAAIGNGFVTLNFPSTAINVANKYRLAFYMDTAGTLNLWTKAGGLDLRREIIGTYAAPSATIGDGTYRSNNEFYWSLETAPAYSIDSIDSDNILEPGQTFTINTTGFTGQPVATTNNVDITVTITGGSGNVWTATINERTDGASYPLLPLAGVTLTLTNGAETANRLFTVTQKTTEKYITFLSANTTDGTYISCLFAQLGYTVEGAGLHYIPPAGGTDLVITHDGTVSVKSPGIIKCWFRPVTGTGAGKVFYYDVSTVLLMDSVTANMTTVLLSNPQSPRFASNSSAGKRKLYPLKFTPDVLFNGQGVIGSEAFIGTNTRVQKNGSVAEGLSSYEFNIAQGVTYPWGAAHTFANKPKGTVINVQFSVFFPTDFDWTATAGGRLKFPRVHTSCTDFSYFKYDTGTGTIPANGTVISSSGWSATFAGLTAGQNIDTVSAPMTAGQAMPADGYIRVTGATGTLTNGTLTGIGANATAAVSANEGWNDIYILNTANEGASKDGRLSHITEPTGGYNVGTWTESAVNLTKGSWETLEGRIVLDNVAMSNGGTARTQWWILRNNAWLPVVDIQNESTLNRATSVADSFVLFSYWNGGSPQTQKMFMDRLVLHFNPATLVDIEPNTGVKMIGGIAP